MSDLSVRAEPVEMAALAHDDRVHRRAYTDAAVFDAEMERIFGRSWIYVAHESQIPSPGDFVTTDIGGQPVIVTRDGAGAVQVLMNRCPHRAAVVCVEESGSTRAFRCAYHGWTFRPDGSLIGVAYGDGYAADAFVPGELDLAVAPRVDRYRGFVFASLSPSGPTLRQHLGLASDYVDLFCDLAPGGEINLAVGRHRYGFTGNWKLQVENGVDGYHAGMVHSGYLEAAGGPNNPFAALFHGSSAGESADLGNGHALLDFRPELGDFFERRMRSTPEGEAHYRQLVDRLGADRASIVARANGGQGMNLLVFPNILIIQSHLRVVSPRAVDRTDVTLFPATLVDAPDSLNRARLRAHESFYGPAGGGAPDDLEMFRRMHDGLKVRQVEWLRFDRGAHRTRTEPDGRLVGHITDEHPQRAFYRRWREEMAG